MYSKYRNKKVYKDGKKIADSKKEEKRLNELRLLERVGEIRDLKIQVPFILIPSFKYNNKTIRETKYIADFTYEDKENNFIVEDVKSKATRTRVYMIKKKLMLFRYGIEIKEI